MKKSIMKKWVAALRSDEYKQGKDVLHNTSNNTYCCLGVLCDLAMQEGICDFEYGLFKMGEYDNNSFKLPVSVKKWSGISSNSGEYNTIDLINENDNGKSFEEIAIIIEQNYKKL